jgi:hypothetical protein
MRMRLAGASSDERAVVRRVSNARSSGSATYVRVNDGVRGLPVSASVGVDQSAVRDVHGAAEARRMPEWRPEFICALRGFDGLRE